VLRHKKLNSSYESHIAIIILTGLERMFKMYLSNHSNQAFIFYYGIEKLKLISEILQDIKILRCIFVSIHWLN